MTAAVPALRLEGTIGLIAPAGPAALDVEKAGQWMRARGYDLRIYPGVYERDGYLAGSDEVRLRDLHAAFANPDVDAIFCLRGGYGTPRLLDALDFDLLRANPKPFVGYSDITALHLAINRYAGFATFHGPMLNADLLVASNNPPSPHCSACCVASWAPAACLRTLRPTHWPRSSQALPVGACWAVICR